MWHVKWCLRKNLVPWLKVLVGTQSLWALLHNSVYGLCCFLAKCKRRLGWIQRGCRWCCVTFIDAILPVLDFMQQWCWRWRQLQSHICPHFDYCFITKTSPFGSYTILISHINNVFSIFKKKLMCAIALYLLSKMSGDFLIVGSTSLND